MILFYNQLIQESSPFETYCYSILNLQFQVENRAAWFFFCSSWA